MMNPTAPAVLAELAALMARSAMPGVPEAERASDLGLSAMLLGIAAEVWDRQAAVLVEENAALRDLLGVAGADADFHLTALQAENNRLRDRVTDLHARAEATGDADLQDRIWAELVRSTERRRLASAPV